MTSTLTFTAFLGVLFLSALFSGSETGIYSLSSVRLDADAREGRRSARLLRRLLKSDTGLLITLLIGNNLMIELATHMANASSVSASVPTWAQEILVTIFLTPVIFFFAEVLPKDLFRRRPHTLLAVAAPFLSLARLLLLPLAWPLHFLTFVFENVFGVAERDRARVLRREEMLEIIEMGTLAGALEPHAEELARNVLVLRETPVSGAMIPWSEVRTVRLDDPPDEVRRITENSEFTRVPAVRSENGSDHVVGYLYQLDLWRKPDVPGPESWVRPIPVLAPDLPLDRALLKLRTSGQRLALVGTPEAPQGLITLMDLLAAISGEPVG